MFGVFAPGVDQDFLLNSHPPGRNRNAGGEQFFFFTWYNPGGTLKMPGGN